MGSLVITGNTAVGGLYLGYDLAEPTFYDDQDLIYSIGKPVEDLDRKRGEWLEDHPSFAAGIGDQILLELGLSPPRVATLLVIICS